jgi:hypothetical protein
MIEPNTTETNNMLVIYGMHIPPHYKQNTTLFSINGKKKYKIIYSKMGEKNTKLYTLN